jgi:hypothetical protein
MTALSDALQAAQQRAVAALGSSAPAEQAAKRNGEPEQATDAQWKYLRTLADERKMTAPAVPLTKEQASTVIEQLKAGSYDPDAWAVQF